MANFVFLEWAGSGVECSGLDTAGSMDWSTLVGAGSCVHVNVESSALGGMESSQWS